MSCTRHRKRKIVVGRVFEIFMENRVRKGQNVVHSVPNYLTAITGEKSSICSVIKQTKVPGGYVVMLQVIKEL